MTIVITELIVAESANQNINYLSEEIKDSLESIEKDIFTDN